MTHEYKSIARAKTRLRYHIIFSTKYRRQALLGIEQVILDAFRDAESKSDFRILEMMPDKDHLHLLITFKPALSIEQVVRRMKQLTTFYMWEHEPEHLQQFYWGPKRMLWTNGYFCSTVGDVSEDNVIEYIRNQG